MNSLFILVDILKVGCIVQTSIKVDDRAQFSIIRSFATLYCWFLATSDFSKDLNNSNCPGIVSDNSLSYCLIRSSPSVYKPSSVADSGLMLQGIKCKHDTLMPPILFYLKDCCVCAV